MTPIADMIREMSAAGVAMDVILLAVEAVEKASIPRNSTESAEEKRKRKDRERKRLSKEIPRNSTEFHGNAESASLYKQGSKKEERKEEAVRGSFRGQRLPENWEPSPQDRVTAEALIGDRIAVELDKFRDHWKQQPGGRGVKLDWDAAWRNWFRRAAEFSGGKNGKTGSKIIQAADDLCRKIASFDGPQREPGIRDTEIPFAPRLLSNR